MIAKRIEYSKRFSDKWQRLPAQIKKIALVKEALLRSNPLHPSLRLHQLHGKYIGSWSISITEKYRIIFEQQDDGLIVFSSIGNHDIYRYL